MFNWFKKKGSGPDFSSLNSREKVEAATRSGDLVPMLLMPKEFGGPDAGPNVVFVPAWAAQQKQRIDIGTILPLAQDGKIKQYSAKPSYKGDSFVPSVVTVHAHDPSDFTATIEVW
ncbi:hypothetical protein [Rhodanobacter sp. DHB23]|uniref:hypothetical protein n=1 Tax=Rhodanobacter sp. DHB23 TaxID=2775923 RepID=UPI0017851923|nr:hypothetical protein [Rhodanobacter sp. DHB23]MBD8871509.1 hypothetical protein [Rhodanobacter sp. DHB23]